MCRCNPAEMLHSLIFNFAIVSISVIIGSVALDQCNVELCRSPGKHTLCLYPVDVVGSFCQGKTMHDVTNIYQHVLLDHHLSLRQMHTQKTNKTLAVFQWDNDLATAALRWAKQCFDHRDDCRSFDKFKTKAFQNVAKEYQPEIPTEEQLKFDGMMRNVILRWSTIPNNPIDSMNEKFDNLNRIGCGVFQIKRCNHNVKASKACNIFHIVCNYSEI